MLFAFFTFTKGEFIWHKDHRNQKVQAHQVAALVESPVAVQQHLTLALLQKVDNLLLHEAEKALSL
jgi:hypothetical protein